MAKWIIRWNTGYGDTHEIIESDTKKDADQAAYEYWHEEVQSNSDYEAMPYSKELAIELCLEDDDEE